MVCPVCCAVDRAVSIETFNVVHRSTISISVVNDLCKVYRRADRKQKTLERKNWNTLLTVTEVSVLCAPCVLTLKCLTKCRISKVETTCDLRRLNSIPRIAERSNQTI